MTSERVQRRIDGLLDQAEEVVEARDWSAVDEIARSVLAVDAENADAQAFLAMAAPHVGGASPDPAETQPDSAGTHPEALEGSRSGDAPPSNVPPLPYRGEGRGEGKPTPTSFANGRYTVSDFLGEGGKKRVYLAHDTLLDREVAFALIKTEGFDETSRSRITREAQAMGRLGTHPNIVTVFDLGVEGSDPYMVTELMGGGDVEGLLEGTGKSPSPQPSPAKGRGGKQEEVSPDNTARADSPSGEGSEGGPPPTPMRSDGLPLARSIEIGKAICNGLEFAHSRGIVHRDLKPGNVWLTDDGTAKIGDFGLAMMTDRSRLTREDMMVGTVSYMPPEQATGGDITSKADLYSLGAMLYELVTGRPPFLGDTDVAIIGQHINTAPVAPTWHNGDCPRPLEALIMRLLAKDPSERPDSAQDVFNALDAIDLAARGETVEREANSLESLAGGVFVGRQAEMDQLRAALEDVLGGRGRLVTLVGEPGIGKTRTSEELTTYAGLRGAQVLWGRCYEGGGAPPYWPWVQAIRSYVRDIDPDELRRQMGSSASVVAEVVTDVKDRLPEVQPPPKIDDPNSARFRLFDSITSFLKTASQSQPLVIVLDDLHWSDQPSLTFLEFIARELNQSRVLLLCTYRDMELNRRHPLSVTLGDLARERLYERVLLRGLTQADIGRFVEIAAGFTPPVELPATVYRHTEGNPLFVTEVIRDLVQSGELTEEKVSGRSSWSVRIPEGVREVIGRRLDRLSDRANEIFTTAAVIGRDFTLAALRELGEDTTDGQLLDVLDEALDAKLIEEISDEIGHYQFTHALVQETLTGELSSARKVRLHARIAETLERIYGDAADEHAAELVPHFDDAEPVLGPEKLIQYALRAGDDALAAYANEQAEAMFARALEAMGDAPTDEVSASALTGLGRARLATHYGLELSNALDPLERAFAYYSKVGNADRAAYVALQKVLSQPGTMSRTAPMLEQALEMVPDNSLIAGYLYSSLARTVGYDLRDSARSESLSQTALRIARSHGDQTLELQTLLDAIDVSTTGNNLSIADEYLSQAEPLINKATRIEPLARFHLRKAHVSMRTNDVDEAERHLKIGRQLAEGMGIRNMIADGLLAEASLRWTQGDLVAARALATHGVKSFPISARFRAIEATIALDQGDRDPADTYIDLWDSSVFDGSGGRSDFSRTYSMLFMSVLVYKSARIEKSRDLFSKAIEISERAIESGTVDGVTINLAHITRALSAVELGDSTRLEESYQLLRSLDFAPFRLFGTLDSDAFGMMAAGMGDYEASVRYFEDALESARRHGYRLYEAWTCSDYAEMLLDSVAGTESASADASRKKATELQDQALLIANETGMRPLTERILARREILRA